MSNPFYNYQSVFLPRTIVPSARFNAHFVSIAQGFDLVYADLQTKLDGSRNVIAGTGLTGGGSIINDVTLSFDQTWGDARYALSGHNHSGVYAPVVHGHAGEDITSGTVPSARLPVFAGFAPGAVPASDGSTTKFLGADGLWKVPAGGGGGGGGGTWGTIAGNIADQADLQAALTSKADKAVTISPGTGLTGGGNISANRLISFDTAWGDARYAGVATTMSAGTGLTGGGNLSANRSFALDLTYTDARYAAAGHTHPYVAKSGDTMTGNLAVPYVSASGATAGFGLGDRNNSSSWLQYSVSSIWRLHLIGTGDLVTVSAAGQLSATSFICSNWFRSTGNSGWYSETYGGGIYMVDTTWVRTYNGSSFYSTGSILAAGDITAFSDVRLKTNIETIEGALGKVGRLRGVTFDRIDTGQRQAGLIAQEVVAVLPEVVSEGPDGYLTLAYGNVVGLLVEAIKELRAEVAELRNAAAR